MKLFIWHGICCVTDEYHNGGSLMVVAPPLRLREGYGQETQAQS